MMIKVDRRKVLEAEALEFIFSNFSEQVIRFAILRNYESLPYEVGSRDIDILVHPEDLEPAIKIILALCRRLKCVLSNYYRDDMFTSIWLFQRLDNGQIFNLSVDLFPGRKVYGIEFLAAEEVLSEISYYRGIPIVSDRHLFLDKWLYNLVVGCPTHPKYDENFARIANECDDELVQKLQPLLGCALASEMIRQVCLGESSRITPLKTHKRVAILLRFIFGSGLKGISGFTRFLFYRIKDRLPLKGTFISVSGPDGCGKTTVIDLVIAELNQIHGPASVEYRHFRPEALPRIADVAKAAHAIEKVDKDYSNPHRAKPSGRLGSLVRVGYYYLDYLVGYFRSVRPVLLKREIMLFDRYYFDMICDPARSRISLPYGFLRLVGRLLPLPKYAFFIHVDPREVYQRKQELTLERIEELNSRYLGLVRCGMLREVSNNGPSHEAVAQIVDTIVKDRDARARRDLQSVYP